MAKAGKKRPLIDWGRVDEALIGGANGEEICSLLGICRNSLYKYSKKDKNMHFSEYAQQKRECGDVILRVTQFDEAVNKRNITMLIFLGKVRLGQSEKVTLEHQGSIPMQIVNYSDQPIEPWKETSPSTSGRKFLTNKEEK